MRITPNLEQIRFVVVMDNMPNWMFAILDTIEERLVQSDKPPGWKRFRSEQAAQKAANAMNKENAK